MENNTSTVAYRSNLYPISSNSFREDRLFLAQVHDPFSLEQMKKQGLSLDSFQEKEYRQASVHCSYAFKDDYPWGTISMPDGKKAVACRCTNTKCHLFVKCRPDFDFAELAVYDENKQSTALIFSLEKIKQSEKLSPSQDQEAANALFRKPAPLTGTNVDPNQCH